MIEKIIPRALDKSSDKKIVSNTSMIDALNLFLSEDNIDGEGNKGVLKNVKGNSLSEYAWPEDKPSSMVATGPASKVIGLRTLRPRYAIFLCGANTQKIMEFGLMTRRVNYRTHGFQIYHKKDA